MRNDDAIPSSSHPNAISSIAHKIRTPLTVIMSTVNNLLDGAFGKLNEEQAKWLKKLESHTTHLEKLLNDILDMLKTEPEKADTIQYGLDEKEQPKLKSNSKVAQTKKSIPIDSGLKKVTTILIVDDEPDILDTIQESLQIKNYITHVASNGDDAMRIALEVNPDLILMDVQLKNQNGLELCRKIKSRVKSFTPVIMMTGQDDMRDKIAATNEDADDLLTKPFQMIELFTRVTSMLRLKELSDELERVKRGGE